MKKVMPSQDKSKDVEMSASQVAETTETSTSAHEVAVSKPSDPTLEGNPDPLASAAAEPKGQPAPLTNALKDSETPSQVLPAHRDSKVAGNEASPGSGSMPLSQKGSDAFAPVGSLAKHIYIWCSPRVIMTQVQGEHISIYSSMPFQFEIHNVFSKALGIMRKTNACGAPPHKVPKKRNFLLNRRNSSESWPSRLPKKLWDSGWVSVKI